MLLSGLIWSSLCVFAIVLVYIGIPFLYSKYCKWMLRCKTSRLQALVLTFDDGPGRRLTPKILSLLSEFRVRATFFVLGRNISDNQQTLQSMVASGHEVCSHGFYHLHYWKVSPWRSLADMKKAWKSIDNALGRNSCVYPFRPPGGKLNILCLLFLIVKKVPIVYWTDVSGDTFMAKEPDVSTNTLFMPSDTTGVVLAHDFDRAEEEIEDKLLDWLRILLLSAKKSNIRVLTVSELLGTNYG